MPILLVHLILVFVFLFFLMGLVAYCSCRACPTKCWATNGELRLMFLFVGLLSISWGFAIDSILLGQVGQVIQSTRHLMVLSFHASHVAILLSNLIKADQVCFRFRLIYNFFTSFANFWSVNLWVGGREFELMTLACVLKFLLQFLMALVLWLDTRIWSSNIIFTIVYIQFQARLSFNNILSELALDFLL